MSQTGNRAAHIFYCIECKDSREMRAGGMRVVSINDSNSKFR